MSTESFQKSSNLLRVHGILSLIFGILGLIGIAITSIIFFLIADYVGVESEDGISFFIGAIMLLVFGLVPHVYLIISGRLLMNKPAPSTALTLVIINLIVGVFWNFVILIFSIINLVQFSDYQNGFKAAKAKK